MKTTKTMKTAKPFSRTLLAVACAGALAVATTPAARASATGWRIIDVLNASQPYPILQGDTATGPGDAWAVGTTTQSLVVEQWNGAQWQSVAPPASLTGLTNKSVNDGVVGDTSATNLWTFPSVSGPKASTNYALNWNGSTWTSYELTGTRLPLFTTAVFSPADVWAFGQKPVSGGGLGFGAPWAEQFNGTSWQQVSMPGTPLDVSAISANDMWAFGPNRATAGKAVQTYIAMRWDGTSWQTVKLPKLAPVQGQPWAPSGMVALSDSNVWLSELVQGSPGTGTRPNNVDLLHWDGSTWTKVAENASMQFEPGLTSDGNGGFWLTASNSVTSYLFHYTGTWTKVVAPTESGYNDAAGSLVLIPGTTSVWGLGTLQPASGGGPAESAILKRGN
jgi:hypothetical protein